MALEDQGAQLLFDHAGVTPNAVARLLHVGPRGSTRTWKTLIDVDDFAFNINAEYASPYEEILEDNNARLALGSTAINLGADFLGIDASIKVMTISNKLMSTLQWTSSERPAFELTLYFITIDERDNIERDAVELQSMTLPRSHGDDRLGLSPPGGYSNGGVQSVATTGGTALVGGWILELGTWFRAPNLVLENAIMSESPIRTVGNKPLYVEVTVQLRPYQLITDTDFREYFRQI